MSLRERSMGGFSPSNVTITGTNNQGQQIPTDVAPVGSCTGNYKWMRDSVTPSFERRSSRGEIINNGLSRTDETRSWSSGNMHRIYPGTLTTYHYTGPIFPWYFGWPGALRDASTLQDSAVISAFAGVQQTDVNLPVFAAEFGKTCDMFRQIGRKARTVRQLLATGVLTAKELSSLWLEYRYGWRPLVYDLQGALKALDRAFGRSSRQTSRGFSSGSETWSEDHTYSYAGISYYGHSDYTQVTQCRAGVLYEHFLSPSDSLGLSIYHTPETVWELVPFSFVVDWFINVGDWLQAIRPKPGVNTLSSWCTVTRTLAVSSYCNGASTGTSTLGYKITQFTGSAGRTFQQKDRIAGVGVPWLPSSGSGLNLFRGIDAAMLSIQQLRKIL